MTDARRTRGRRVAVSVSVLGLAAVTGLWLSRVPIATGVIDRHLAAKGVRARYHIADLGLGRQRLTKVVIGDPRHPDLVADWVETVTDMGLSGPRLVAIHAGHVRARGRHVDGRLTLGEIDRLLSGGGGGAFTLPAIDVALDDARMRIETPYGDAGLALTGHGRLDGGFAGRFALIAGRLGTADCAGRRVSVAGTVRSTGRDRRGGYGLDLDGPVRAASLACAGTSIAAPRLATTATLVLGRLGDSTLRAEVATGAIVHPQARAAALSGTVSGRLGTGSDHRMTLRLAARDLAALGTRAGRLSLDGEAAWDASRQGFAGRVAVADVDARAAAPSLASAGAGTPVAPLLARIGMAMRRAAADMSGEAEIAATRSRTGWQVLARSARLSSASGARASLTTDVPLDWRSTGRLAGAGAIAIGGGGLPQARVAFSRRGDAAPLTAIAHVAPYAADGAALALTPVRIVGNATTYRLTTAATMTGPLAGGRVERLALPLDLRIAGARVTANPACTPLAFDRLTLSSLDLRPARLTLCPTAGALVTSGPRGVAGVARIAAPRLTGTLGGTPLDLAATGATVSLGDRGFTATDLAARLGAPGRVTTLDVARLDGRVTARGLAGTLSGAGGQIANVPLVMSAAGGEWTFADGKVGVTGTLTVSDAQTGADRRFNPMAARDVAFGLANGEIGVAGRLVEPVTGTQVATVAIGHRLSTGAGRATLDVSGITFGDTLQPDRLTPLTFGVIADVKGSVKGQGVIDWNADGVTSTGTFSTEGTNLAAAFGPVEGLSGTIRFTDLLALESAPGQVATVASINPGVPVTDGRIVYQTLPGTRVKVESGTWPFAGGALTLDPTLLDFGSDTAKRMTFHVSGMDAGKFLQQFDFENLNATGTFDGVLPMVFDDSGGRIEGGKLASRSGGSIAYVGALTEKQLGFWGDFAFQALKSLTYRDLDIAMDGPLAGEMVTQVRVAGVRQGKGAKSNFLVRRLTRLPIQFNIQIRAPFRGLIDSAASFYDPSRLVQRNLQTLLQEQNRRTQATGTAPVQPPASETVP
jgi:hypothetical protein